MRTQKRQVMRFVVRDSRRFAGEAGRRGAVAIQVAIMLVAIIGFISLGSEVVLLILTARQMQAAADAAALAAATARSAGYPADYTQEARALARAAGFVDNAPDGTTVAVRSPPAQGNYAGSADAIEVAIAQPRSLPLASVVHAGQFVVGARAVARVIGYGPCMLVLDGASDAAFSMTGSSNASFVDCGLTVDSSSASAVSLVGGGTLSATTVRIVGGDSLKGGSSIDATDGIVTGATATPDPYADRTIPAPSGCSYNSFSMSGGSRTISQGTFCNGLSLTGAAQLTLQPGIYIIDGGSFSLAGGNSISGTGVTIVLTSSTGSGYATASVAGGSTINLTAPTSGATAGMLFFQDPRAPHSGSNSLSGGAGQSLTGAVYFPSQPLTYSGGNSLTSQCTQIVAWQVRLTGNAAVTVNCAGTGVLPIGGGSVKLVE